MLAYYCRLQLTTQQVLINDTVAIGSSLEVYLLVFFFCDVIRFAEGLPAMDRSVSSTEYGRSLHGLACLSSCDALDRGMYKCLTRNGLRQCPIQYITVERPQGAT